ncbi:DUF2252 domain-containing protein [Chitinophagaceae bacterium LWZ2-11]
MSASDSVTGKALRKNVPRSSQADLKITSKRPTVLSFITESNKGRLQDLVPIRHQRMSVSPFTFYRGAASIMAYDLSKLPHTNLQVQAMGDCHLMNFGGFATPERSLVFDANDFDETHPAPWEWDLKRLATSFVLAARSNGLKDIDGVEMAHSLTQSYREHVAEFAEMNMLDLWYMKFDLETMRNTTKNETIKHMLDDALLKAHKSTHQKVFYKITQNVLGNFEITNQPPLVYHAFDMEEDKRALHSFLEKYIASLQPDRQFLLSHYKTVDIALKVVGVGSVGTRCYVALLMNDKQEALFLQIKEARESVLEPYTGKSVYKHAGERVVQGQRLVQAASDIFLGWSTGFEGKHFYIRQLRDKKIAPDVDHFDKEILSAYARLCGRMLARAHTKTGTGHLLASYMGKSAALDESISKFALTYANQTEKDYEAFMKAIKEGKLKVQI